MLGRRLEAGEQSRERGQVLGAGAGEAVGLEEARRDAAELDVLAAGAIDERALERLEPRAGEGRVDGQEVGGDRGRLEEGPAGDPPALSRSTQAARREARSSSLAIGEPARAMSALEYADAPLRTATAAGTTLPPRTARAARTGGTQAI
jgi:hypothetical protein